MVEQEKKDRIVLGYWGIRGLAHPIRHLLVYLGIPFLDRVYPDPKKWFEEDKPNFKGQYPNLPYLEDGSFILTESTAIPIYLINKAAKQEPKYLDLLGGGDPQIAARVQQIIAVLQDYWKGVIVPLIFDPNFEKRKGDAWEKAVTRQVDRFQKSLGSNNWITGDKLTYADFQFYEYLNYIKGIFPEQFKSYDSFVQYIKRFEELPNVRNYMASKDYLRAPFMPPERAQWTGL